MSDWFKQFLSGFGDLNLVEAGRQPTSPIEQIDELIDQSDLLCAIVTAREGAIPEWISYEVSRGRARGIPIFAFLEEGIRQLGCFSSALTYLKFNRETLGIHAPDYVKYVCESRRLAYKRRGESRQMLQQLIHQLRNQVNQLTISLELEEEMRDRIDDL